MADVLLALARSAFVDGMTAAVATGAAVVLGGAALALAFLPGRERSMREPAAVGPRRPDEPEPEVAAA